MYDYSAAGTNRPRMHPRLLRTVYRPVVRKTQHVSDVSLCRIPNISLQTDLQSSTQKTW